jgi:hypothetical protein
MVSAELILPATISTADGLTVEGAGPELLEELLDAYAFELKKSSPAIYDSMLPGLSVDQIHDLLGEIGVVPSPELLVWWGWRNGHVPFFGHGLNHDQMSLETAIKLYKDESLGTNHWEWNPNWIRIAGEGNSGDAARWNDNQGATFVRHVSTFDIGTQDDESILRQVVSICTPVTWWLYAIAEGWDSFDVSSGFWDYDESKYPPDWRVTLLM